MKYVIAATYGLFILYLTACGQNESASEEKLSQNKGTRKSYSVAKLPDFTLSALTGENVNLRNLEGSKIVVVNFWATWCGPCRKEIPDFNKIYTAYKDRNVEFLGISVDESAKKQVTAFMKKTTIQYPILLGSPGFASRYQITGLPTTYIIGRDGYIAKRFVGMVNARILEAELEKLL